jgi:hypothetical protein
MSRLPKILMYHSIHRLANDPNQLCTSPERFEAQMLYLKQCGLRGVSMRELRKATSTGDTKGLVGLTFDDGYEDFLHSAVPIMERLGFSATVFVVANMLGEQSSWKSVHEPIPRLKVLEAEELREISARGMEVGSHSMTHVMLCGLDSELLEREVNDSCCVLSEALGETVKGFPIRHTKVAIIGAGTRGEFREGDQMCCAWIEEGLVNAGYTCDEQTAKLVKRWSGVPVDAFLGSKSVEYLTRSGQESNLNFILEHIDDVNAVFTLKNNEITSVPVSTRASQESRQPSRAA